MKNKSFVDCFMLMGTALSLKGGKPLTEMNRPLLQDVFTTFVNLSLAIEEFSVVNIKNMEFELAGLLNQKWVDPRLGANEKTRKMAVAGQIWKPKIVNINGNSKLINNDDTIFWRGYGEEGNVLLSEKIQIHGSCTKNFHNFPFDKQFCQVKIGSYRFPNDEMSIVWDKTSVEILNDIEINEFSLLNVSTYDIIDVRASGNFSVAVIQLHIQRRSTHYIICTGVPCIAMVILNYISLWLKINERTKRFTLNLLSLNLNIYFYYFSTCSIQPVPYLKAMDIFIAICICFSLFSLLETIVIDRLCNIEEDLYHLQKQASCQEYPKFVYWLEFGMKVSFPVFYVFFVSLYSAIFINT